MRPSIRAFRCSSFPCPSLRSWTAAFFEEAAIRSVLARETHGLNTFNATEVTSAYAEDVIWQNPFVVRLHGRKEVETFLTDLLARPGYRRHKHCPHPDFGPPPELAHDRRGVER